MSSAMAAATSADSWARRRAPRSAADHGSAAGRRVSTVAAVPVPTAAQNVAAASTTRVSAVVAPKRSTSKTEGGSTPERSTKRERRRCARASRDTPAKWTVVRGATVPRLSATRVNAVATAAARAAAVTGTAAAPAWQARAVALAAAPR